MERVPYLFRPEHWQGEQFVGRCCRQSRILFNC